MDYVTIDDGLLFTNLEKPAELPDMVNNLKSDVDYLTSLEKNKSTINVLINEITKLNEQLATFKNVYIKTHPGFNVYTPEVTEQINCIRYMVKSRIDLIVSILQNKLQNNEWRYSLPNEFMHNLDSQYCWLRNDLRKLEDDWIKEIYEFLELKIEPDASELEKRKAFVNNCFADTLLAIHDMKFEKGVFAGIDIHSLPWPMTNGGLYYIHGIAFNDTILLSPPVYRSQRQKAIQTLYHEVGHIFWNIYTGDFQGNNDFGKRYDKLRLCPETANHIGNTRAELLADDFAYIYFKSDKLFDHRYGGTSLLLDPQIKELLDARMTEESKYFFKHNLLDIYNIVSSDFELEVDSNLDNFRIKIYDILANSQ